MSKSLKITVEFTIDNPTVQLSQMEALGIKNSIEFLINNPELAKYLWSLGDYHDAEVVKVKQKKEKYDTRQ